MKNPKPFLSYQFFVDEAKLMQESFDIHVEEKFGDKTCFQLRIKIITPLIRYTLDFLSDSQI